MNIKGVIIIALLLSPAIASADNNFLLQTASFSMEEFDAAVQSNYYVEQLELEKAWNLTTGSPEVKVAILSTGINYRLPALASSIALNLGEMGEGKEYDGIDNDNNGFVDDVYGYDTFENNPDPVDRFGVGTHSASLVNFIAPQVKLIPIKVVSDIGVGSWDSVMAGMEYAKVRGADIVLLGVGGAVGDFSPCEKISSLGSKGILVVGPVGNEGSLIGEDYFPVGCKSSNLVSVTATDVKSELTSFANWNPVLVHLGAPGVGISGIIHDGTVVPMSGTSISAAVTAGVAALLMSHHPEYSLFKTKEALLRGVDFNPTLSGKTVSGGRVNAFKALEVVVP